MVLWVFGYGSVMWTREFHYVERVVGYVKDHQRVLAECGDGGSPISTSPGSANWGLALEPQEGSVTRGVAYRVTEDVEQEILSSYMGNGSSPAKSRSQAIWLDFFTPSAPDFPSISGVMTYVNPPESSPLWYVVPQEPPQLIARTRSEPVRPRNPKSGRSGKIQSRRSVDSRRPTADGLDSQFWSRENAPWQLMSYAETGVNTG